MSWTRVNNDSLNNYQALPKCYNKNPVTLFDFFGVFPTYCYTSKDVHFKRKKKVNPVTVITDIKSIQNIKMQTPRSQVLFFSHVFNLTFNPVTLVFVRSWLLKSGYLYYQLVLSNKTHVSWPWAQSWLEWTKLLILLLSTLLP